MCIWRGARLSVQELIEKIEKKQVRLENIAYLFSDFLVYDRGELFGRLMYKLNFLEKKQGANKKWTVKNEQQFCNKLLTSGERGFYYILIFD